jgi:DNA processing protein
VSEWGEIEPGLLLWGVSNIGSKRYRQLLSAFGGAEAAISAGPSACAELLGSPHLEEKFQRSWPTPTAGRELADSMFREQIHLLELSRSGFPPGLVALDEPEWLFVKGDAKVLSEPLAAVVGTRQVRRDGVRLTRRVVDALARRGWNTVSGGALGVDAEAHRRSLELGIRTVVVLPGGLMHQVPGSHRRLYDSICATGGCLVSEHPPLRAPRRELFVRRNRLISGLAAFTVVVRAPRRSGALITADWARRQGRSVYVVPGSPDDPTAAGCLEETRRGAILLATPEELPNAPGFSEASGEGASGFAVLGSSGLGVSESSPIVEALRRSGAATVEDIGSRVALEPAYVMRELVYLELRGEVERLGPGLYRAGKP